MNAFRKALEDAWSISPYRRPLVEMMERLARYPRQFEIGAKMGFSDAIAEIFYNKYASNHLINLRGNNVAQILRASLLRKIKDSSLKRELHTACWICGRNSGEWGSLFRQRLFLRFAMSHIL